MTETTASHEYTDDREDEGLNWARIAGISAAIAVHVAALMLLMAPVSPPPSADEQADRVDVQFIEPPPSAPSFARARAKARVTSRSTSSSTDPRVPLFLVTTLPFSTQ